MSKISSTRTILLYKEICWQIISLLGLQPVHKANNTFDLAKMMLLMCKCKCSNGLACEGINWEVCSVKCKTKVCWERRLTRCSKHVWTGQDNDVCEKLTSPPPTAQKPTTTNKIFDLKLGIQGLVPKSPATSAAAQDSSSEFSALSLVQVTAGSLAWSFHVHPPHPMLIPTHFTKTQDNDSTTTTWGDENIMMAMQGNYNLIMKTA